MDPPGVMLVEEHIEYYELRHHDGYRLEITECTHRTFPVCGPETVELLQMCVSHLHSALQRQLQLVNLLDVRVHVRTRRCVDFVCLANIPRVTKGTLTRVHSREHASRQPRNGKIVPASWRYGHANWQRHALRGNCYFHLDTERLLVLVPEVKGVTVKVAVPHLRLQRLHRGRVQNEGAQVRE